MSCDLIFIFQDKYRFCKTSFTLLCFWMPKHCLFDLKKSIHLRLLIFINAYHALGDIKNGARFIIVIHKVEDNVYINGQLFL